MAAFCSGRYMQGIKKVSNSLLPSIAAIVADPEKLKRVKDQLEIVCFRSRYLKFMDWTLTQRLGGSTTHAGEVVLVSLDRRV